ncbi:F0F1 ATP synthase subunit alpha [Advenella kashmirensis WT001]|uniref:F0F1 ATP synthase subunit alpha n=1 Tax=Advenella kashmirensis (strain DSM 17095 / LMG 22695 / WT001) TaxID=1036672 RepID=I3U8Z9_ADVKW|nr:F0F1 ATP synthase subunit alpha [Advenella kashmirensis WT001]
MQVWELAVSLYAVNNGYLDEVEVEKVLSFEKGLKDELKNKHADLIGRIEDTKELSKEDEAALKDIVASFKSGGSY